MKTGGRIRDEDVEEVRRRSSLVDVAAEYMQLRRAGRLYKALCPFHAEKTPSFSLDPAKGLWYCFGACAEGGDVYQLVRKLENLSFVEAVERLARRAGYELRYEQLSAADRSAYKRRSRLIDAHRAAVELYHHALLGPGDEATAARAYLKRRGFGKETAEAFRLGLSLRRDELCRHLRERGFTETEVLESGLGARAEHGGLVDRFRGRLMFPVFDVTGDPVAFGARTLREGEMPKYINSAESPIYKKGQVLYALDRAKGDAVKRGRALVVEGYTDVIALHEAGITETVATCGTALGLDHLKMLQRFTQQVILSLDADQAGGAAAERVYDQLAADAQALGLSLRVVLMQPGKDPADSVAAMGPEGFAALVERAVPLLEFVLRREADRYTSGQPEEKARALAACLRLLAKTEHPGVRDEYARRLSDWIGVDPNVVYVELEKVMRTGVVPRSTGETVLKRSSAQVRLEKEALKLAIQHPALVKPHAEDLTAEHFSVPAHRTIWNALGSGADPALIPDGLEPPARRVYTELAVQPTHGDPVDRLAAKIFRGVKEFAVSRRIEELKPRLQRMNPEDDRAAYDALFAEMIALEADKRKLKAELEEI